MKKIIGLLLVVLLAIALGAFVADFRDGGVSMVGGEVGYYD